MEEDYSYRQLLEIGQAAGNLLQAPVFTLAYNRTLEHLTANIWNTEPGHTRSLEEIRRQGNALAQVTGLLTQFVKEAEVAVQQKGQQKPPGTPDEYAGFNMRDVQ